MYQQLPLSVQHGKTSPQSVYGHDSSTWFRYTFSLKDVDQQNIQREKCETKKYKQSYF